MRGCVIKQNKNCSDQVTHKRWFVGLVKLRLKKKFGENQMTDKGDIANTKFASAKSLQIYILAKNTFCKKNL